jgi:hypothetical protein
LELGRTEPDAAAGDGATGLLGHSAGSLGDLLGLRGNVAFTWAGSHPVQTELTAIGPERMHGHLARDRRDQETLVTVPPGIVIV